MITVITDLDGTLLHHGQLLRWAGHSYAPQNALAVAKRAAKGFCAPCQQQGVSQIVNELIKKG